VSAHPDKRRVVLAALGSFGDVHPYIALGLGLRARGHDVVVATGNVYRQKIEALGLGFHALRPDFDPADRAAMARYMDLRRGTFRIVLGVILPAVRDTYDDILAASRGADLLVSHALPVFAASLVAEKTGVPWASSMITPLGYFSAHDLPVLFVAPELFGPLRCLGPRFWGPAFRHGKRATRGLARPWYRLRAELGLPASDLNPLGGCQSPALDLAMFSKVLAPPQPDWPPQTVQTGFPLYDRDGDAGLPPELDRFLAAGPPPVVFTLGHSSATVAGQFFSESVAAAQRLGRRAVLVLGKVGGNAPPPLPPGMAAFDYAPFSELFPRAAAVVHAGGIGTTGLAMRSGRPALVVPFAHDQPDNAARAARLGIARTLPPHRYWAYRVAYELRRLLDDPAYARRAAAVGEQVRREDGVAAACDALEGLLAAKVSSEPKSPGG
jgi:UDP:flavonoid glycosyltransferase YjiC (YdhE family)